MRPAKTRISLGIRRHSPSLIRVFVVRTKKPWVLSYPSSAWQRLCSDWVEVRANVSLCLVQKSFCWFCPALAHFLWGRARAVTAGQDYFTRFELSGVRWGEKGRSPRKKQLTTCKQNLAHIQLVKALTASMRFPSYSHNFLSALFLGISISCT